MEAETSQFHNDHGVELAGAGRRDEAVAAFRRALEIAPDDAHVRGNLGVTLMQLGRLDEARAALRQAVRLEPGSAALQFNLGGVLHVSGYVDEAIAAYGRAIELQPDAGEAWCSLGVALRLKGELGRSLDAYARAVELLPHSADVRVNLGVALAAQGRIAEAIDSYRQGIVIDPDAVKAHYNLGNALSATGELAAFAPLTHAPGVRLFSLQKGAGADEAAHPPAGMDLVDGGSLLDDYADTAALIAQLDLVISVDTSVAHVAGALGRPTWPLLAFASDWRWMLGRGDTPWYPTMPLFRQPTRGDWAAVIDAVALALRE
jgi:tetratricopeptide (TPR) repeat protein